MALMRKYFIAIVLIIAILAGTCAFLYIRKTEIEENKEVDIAGTPVEIELIGITQGSWKDRLYQLYEMDQPRRSRSSSLSWFWWIQVTSNEEWQELEEEYRIDTPQFELDFGDNYYIISFGRELNGIQYYNEKTTRSEGLYTEVDAEPPKRITEGVVLEMPDGAMLEPQVVEARKVYIYAMDRILLMDTREDYDDLIRLMNYEPLTELPIAFTTELRGDWTKSEGLAYLFDETHLYPRRNEGICWWYQIDWDWEYRQEQLNIDEQSLDLENGRYIISFGRKIEHLWYSTNSYKDEDGEYRHYAKAQFDMDNYDENGIYVYELDREVKLMDTMWDSGDLGTFNYNNTYW